MFLDLKNRMEVENRFFGTNRTETEPSLKFPDRRRLLEGGEALLWQGRGFRCVQQAVGGEDAHAQPGKVPRGHGDCACPQKRGDEGRRNCQVQREDERKKQRFIVWSELVQCLNKVSIHFIRLSQTRRGGSLESPCEEHRSTEKPSMQTLLPQLVGLKMAPGKKLTDYLTRSEGTRLDLRKRGEMTSNAMFSAMVLKCLPPTFESIATVLNFGPRKGYEENPDLTNFANKSAELSTDVGSNALHSRGGNSIRKITCFKCQMEGHKARDCRSKESKACFEFNTKDHLARDCTSKKGNPVAPAEVTESKASSASDALTGLERREDSSYKWTTRVAMGSCWRTGLSSRTLTKHSTPTWGMPRGDEREWTVVMNSKHPSMKNMSK